jgi:hypothetical protein
MRRRLVMPIRSVAPQIDLDKFTRVPAIGFLDTREFLCGASPPASLGMTPAGPLSKTN